jgi:hypothetical protein
MIYDFKKQHLTVKPMTLNSGPILKNRATGIVNGKILSYNI